MTTYDREFYLKRTTGGICVWCGKPRDRDGVYCTACLKRRSELSKKRREKIRDHNEANPNTRYCIQCGGTYSGNFATCDVCRKKDTAGGIKRNAKKRFRVLEHYAKGEPYCMCPSGKCNEKRLKFLSLDHINGGGRKHRLEIGSGGSYYQWIIKNGFPEVTGSFVITATKL